jgi:3-phenylpropionate/cinnamic acid dioxygenase small subunit
MLKKNGAALALVAALAMAGAGVLSDAAATSARTDALGLVQDRMAIEATLDRYVRGLDNSDEDAVAAAFTKDGKFLLPDGEHAGEAAIRQIVKDRITLAAKQAEVGVKPVLKHHVVTNSTFEFVDKNNAIHRAYWMTVNSFGPKGISIGVMGTSEDVLVKQNGQWLIKERKVVW